MIYYILFFLVLIIEIFMPFFVFLIAPGFSGSVDKMNVAYSGQEKRKYDDQGKPIDTSKGYYIPWYDRMAGEEADHLNSIKRQTWKAGGSVGPEPKYVSAQDVKSVYDKK